MEEGASRPGRPRTWVRHTALPAAALLLPVLGHLAWRMPSPARWPPEKERRGGVCAPADEWRLQVTCLVAASSMAGSPPSAAPGLRFLSSSHPSFSCGLLVAFYPVSSLPGLYTSHPVLRDLSEGPLFSPRI